MSAASTWTGIITAPAGAELRIMPKRTAPIVRSIVHGDRVTVHGCAMGDGSAWYHVTYDGRQDGYVRVGEISGAGA